ncbi:MAG TPA: DUF3187 family protein [Candidatus Polarisedimenticolaceae bacterium]|nr:DUF3187 family protein [Candidatus Polarisedimenticolaceae bacterium]
MGAPRRLAVAFFFGLALAARAAEPSDDRPWFHLGPLRIRDLTPFGILRMDFLPAHAVSATPGTWALELNVSYQNTYVLSENVADYLRAKGAGHRVRYDASDVAAILALPGEAYIVDGELGVMDFNIHHRFTRHWGGYLTIPALTFQGGFLDGTIEGFHDLVGVGQEDRDLVARNQFFVVSKTKSGTLVFTSPPSNGLADPVLGARYSVVAEPERWNVIVETAVKPVLREAKPYLSSGQTDYGVQVSGQWFLRRQALYVSGSAVRFGGVRLEGVDHENLWVPTVTGAWEFGLGRGVNGIVQLYSSPSVVRNTDLGELKATKYLTSLGIQGLVKTWVWRLALTENLLTFENTADIAATLSVAKIFPAKKR